MDIRIAINYTQTYVDAERTDSMLMDRRMDKYNFCLSHDNVLEKKVVKILQLRFLN